MMKQKEPRLRLMFPWYPEEWVSHFFFFCLRSHSVHTLSHTYTLVHWCLCLNTSCVVCKARSLIAQLWNFFFSLLHVCDCIFSARLCYRIEQMQIQKWRKTFLLVHIKGHLLISLHSVPSASRSVVLTAFSDLLFVHLVVRIVYSKPE